MDKASILALFDFESELEPLSAEPWKVYQDLADAERLIENAAVQGNIPELTKALANWRALHRVGQWVNQPVLAVKLAISNGQRESLEALLADGVTIPTDVVAEATLARDEWVLNVLLEQRAWNINDTLDLITPSALALVLDDAAWVSWFLERGASPNTQGYQMDLTPLSTAVQSASIATIKTLFEHGGSILCGQLTHHAVRRTLSDRLEVLDFIIAKNPPINNIMYQEDLKMYYDHSHRGLGTPLHEAADKGDIDVVKRLLEAGCHPLIRNSRGEIPLEIAQKLGKEEVVAYLTPITANATEPAYQFTEGKEHDGMGIGLCRCQSCGTVSLGNRQPANEGMVEGAGVAFIVPC